MAIRPEHHRGGVLGMAGLMTFLADGTRTLPMRRGSWVLRELFNDPPNNPPPNAGEIQPNTVGQEPDRPRAARTASPRRRSARRATPSSIPTAWRWRTTTPSAQWRERFNGEGFRGSNAPVLDVSGTFPDGQKFTTLEEYKAGLMAQKDKFARAFSVKLLTYALGRPVGYTDHELVDSLVAVLKNERLPHPTAHPRDRRQRAVQHQIGVAHEHSSIVTQPLPRRTFLKGAGITLALPWLDAMSVRAASVTTAGSIAASETPRRAVFCFFGLGINGRDFTPAERGLELHRHADPQAAGSAAERFHRRLRPEADPFRRPRRRSHLSHRHQHPQRRARSSASRATRNWPQAIGRQTRFPSLTLGIKRGTGFGGNQDQTLSWSPSGTPIPSENRPHVLFDQLFRPDTAETLNQREAEFIRRASVLDSLREEARRLSGSLGADDRAQARRIPHRHSRSRTPHAGREGMAPPAEAERRDARTSARSRGSIPTRPAWNIAAING